MTDRCKAILDAIAGRRHLPWWLEGPRIGIVAALVGTAIMLLVVKLQ